MAALTQALKSLYARSSVSLPEEFLKRYVGDWVPVSDSEQYTYAIRLEGGHLLVDIPSFSPPALELFAASETTFFTRVRGIEMKFTTDPAKPEQTEMELTRSGRPRVMRRVQPRK